MDPSEYRNAKEFLGITNPDIWSNLTGISKDTDKSFSCGRLAVSEKARARIEQMKLTQARATEMLVEKLRNVFDPDIYRIELNPANNDITVIGGPGDISIVFENEGRDHMAQFFYSLRGRGGLRNVFLLYPRTGPVAGMTYSVNDCEWYWWRIEGADPDASRLIGYQSYKNDITAVTFERTLGIKV